MKKILLLASLVLLTTLSCKKEDEKIPQLKFSLEFDETLPRLGNFGEEVSVGACNAAQHPTMKEMSVHYIEFAPDSLTALGMGAIVYKGDETTAGGTNAVDFDKAPRSGEGVTFL